MGRRRLFWCVEVAPPPALLRRGLTRGPRWGYYQQQRRSFLFLPSLPGPGSSSLFRRKHHERKIVPFRPEQLFAVVSDVDKYKEFVPFCVDSKIVRRINENTLDADLAIGFKAFTERYTSRVTTKYPSMVSASSIQSRVFSNLKSTWMFAPGPSDCTTRINFTVEFEVKNPLAAAAVSAFFQDVARQQVRAFERRCAQIYSGFQSDSPPNVTEGVTLTRDGHNHLKLRLSESIQAELWSIRDILLRHSGEAPFGQDDSDMSRWCISLEAFQAACSELCLGKGGEAFGLLNGDPGLTAAIHSGITYMLQRRGRALEMIEAKRTPPLLDEFVLALFMMLKAQSRERARYLFYMIDVDRNGKVEKEELSAALNLYMKSISQAIPDVIVHYLKIYAESEKDERTISLLRDLDALRERSIASVKELLIEIEREIPAAVDEVFERFQLQGGTGINEDEWLAAWNQHEELLDLMSLQGMTKIALFASDIGSQVTREAP